MAPRIDSLARASTEKRRREVAPTLGPMICAIALLGLTLAGLSTRIPASTIFFEKVWRDRFDDQLVALAAAHARDPSHASAMLVGASSFGCAFGSPNTPDAIAGPPAIDVGQFYRSYLDWDMAQLLVMIGPNRLDHLLVDEDAILFAPKAKARAAQYLLSLGLEVHLPQSNSSAAAGPRAPLSPPFQPKMCAGTRSGSELVECSTDCLVQPSEPAIGALIELARQGVDVVTLTVPNRHGAQRIEDPAGLAVRDAMRARLRAAGIDHFDLPVLDDDAFENAEHLNESGRARSRLWLAHFLATRAR